VASEAERHLRRLACGRLRVLMPEARIVHELNVETGKCRVDIAAVAPDRLVFVEIKSRKDKLDRLPEQCRTFAPACHDLVVCYASERWDWSTMYKTTDYRATLWPEDQATTWQLRARHWSPPNTSAMLNLLWAEELRDEGRRAGFQPHSRATRSEMMHRLWSGLTGTEVVAAVCRQLRFRHFPEADEAVPL
jgi:hypothetical protein